MERTLTFNIEDATLTTESLAVLTGAGLTNVKDASVDDAIPAAHIFDLPILKGGTVKVDADTALVDQAEDIFVSDDFPIYGTILDNAGSLTVPCTLASSGDNGDGISGVEPTYVDPENNPDRRVYHISDRQDLVLDFGDQAKGYVGKTMRVFTYIYKKQQAKQITIDAENFAGNFYVEAHTLWREQSTGKDFDALITIPNAKIQSNFTFTMANTGDPSTFNFVLDAFLDYPRFDKTKKVLAILQILADENIHEQETDDVDPDILELDPRFAYFKVSSDGNVTELPGVVAGYDASTWADAGFADDAKNVKFSKLGSYLKASISKTDVEFTGNLNRIDSWEAFSSNASELTGYYIPFAMYAPEGTVLERTDANGDVKKLVFGETGDTAKDDQGNPIMTMVFAVHPDAPIAFFQLKSADGDKVTNYTFDFSRLVFK